jgi:predicted XRE-type DNA-binding protein
MKLNTQKPVEPHNQWFLYDIHRTLDLTQNNIAEALGVRQSRVSDLIHKSAIPTKAERIAMLKVILKRAAQRKDEIEEFSSY